MLQKKTAPVFLSAPMTRRRAPAHLCPPRPDPKAPNGLVMSRELSEFQKNCKQEFDGLMSEFEGRMRDMHASFEGRFGTIANDVTRREAMIETSRRSLREAIDGSRNDEYARSLKAEVERQRQTILALQAELARSREEGRGQVGWDKERYFGALGRDLLDFGTELQGLGEALGRSECPAARGVASRLENMGLDIGEFAENASAYAEEARAACAGD